MSPDHNSFSIKVGEWFEAKAEGRFAIVVVVVMIIIAGIAVGATKAAGLW